jgi:hypothetical protein
MVPVTNLITDSGKAYVSEVYGTSREEIVEMVGGEEAARKLTMRFLRQYPKVVEFIGNRLKKQRARMMVEAMQKHNGAINRGNVGIRISEKWFIFSYRDTDIMTWDTEPDEGDGTKDVVGEYDNSQSTRNQRRVAREAIEEFKKVVQGL